MKRTYKIKGIRPLLTHNGQLSDPTNEWTKHIKLISSKRNKTDADHDELSKREFMGSLYLNKNKVPCIPDHMLEACIISGARAFKLGKKAEAGIRVIGSAELEYDGPKDPDELYKKEFFLKSRVRIKDASVTRTRPKFEDWTVTFIVDYLEDTISADDLDKSLKRAGEVSGLGDWRPKYGLFEVVEIK
jgi:hypothetical protein